MRFFGKSKGSLIILVILTLMAGFVWYTYYDNVFTGLLYNDAMDYASMGRNIARGEGVVSSYITPLGLQYYGVPHPNPWRAPLWPAVLGYSMTVLGFHDNAVALTTGLFFVLTVPLIYLIGIKLFGTAVALASAVLFTFSSQALHFSISGLTESMAVFFMCLWIYSLTLEKLKNMAGSFIIGLIGGLFYLARYNALMVMPFIFLYLLYRSKGKRILTGATFAGGYLLPVLPWFWRNYVLFGSPLFSLQKFEPVMFTPTYPEYTLYMMMEQPKVGEFLIKHFPEMVEKFRAGWESFYGGLLNPQFTGVSAALMVLFLISLLLPQKVLLSQKGFQSYKETGWLKFIVAASFVAQLAALLVIHYIPRLFFIFTPFYIIFGLGLFSGLAYLIPLGIRYKTVFQAAAIGILSCFLITSNLPDWEDKHNPEPGFLKFSEQINYMSGVAGKSDLVVSNDGHIIAWYGDRVAAKIPYSPAMLPELNGFQEAKYLFLSSKASWNIPEADKEWQKIFWNKPRKIYGYQLQQVFGDGSVVYVREK